MDIVRVRPRSLAKFACVAIATALLVGLAILVIPSITEKLHGGAVIDKATLVTGVVGRQRFSLIQVRGTFDALSLRRPSGVVANTTASIFKEVDNGSRAVRVRVRFGSGFGNRLQVVTGLAPGDVVILSDMAEYLDLPRLTLR